MDMFLTSEKSGSKLLRLGNLSPLFPKALFTVSKLLTLWDGMTSENALGQINNYYGKNVVYMPWVYMYLSGFQEYLGYQVTSFTLCKREPLELWVPKSLESWQIRSEWYSEFEDENISVCIDRCKMHLEALSSYSSFFFTQLG